jgi:hypothetical protein
MYGELGAVKGIVDLSPEHALDEAEAFLASQGYSILRRTSTTLTAERPISMSCAMVEERCKSDRRVLPKDHPASPLSCCLFNGLA